MSDVPQFIRYRPKPNGLEHAGAIDLSPLRYGQSVPPPLPLDLLGHPAPWIARAAEAANSPADYVATSLLAAASGAIGNARWAKAWDGWAEPASLWWGAIGEPSSGKSPAASQRRAISAQVIASPLPLIA